MHLKPKKSLSTPLERTKCEDHITEYIIVAVIAFCLGCLLGLYLPQLHGASPPLVITGGTTGR